MTDLYGIALGGALGIIGSAVGQIISVWKDNRRWLADNRKEEYRELLKAITRSVTMWMDYIGSSERDQAYAYATNDAYIDSLRTIRDRIFIAEEIEKAGVYDLWTEAMVKLNKTNNIGEFSNDFKS